MADSKIQNTNYDPKSDVVYEVLNEGFERQNEPIEVDIDEFLYRSGECGCYQIYLVALMMLISFPLGYPTMIFYFIGYDPPWVYNKDIDLADRYGNISDVKVHAKDDHRRCKIDRNEWSFYHDKSTFATEFDLVCERSWLLAFSGSSFFLGWGVGCVLMGYLSDLYGRKTVLIPTLFLDLFLLYIHQFLNSITLVIIVRFIMGVFHAGPTLNSYILVIELVGPNYRVLASNVSGLTWGLGSIIMALHAYYIDDWRILSVCLSAPYMLCVLCAFWFPESVRWLNLHGKKEQAEKILQRAAKWNKRPQNNVYLADLETVKTKGVSYLDLFKSWKVAKIVLLQCYIWFSINMTYYALAWAFADIGGSIYINFVLASLTDIPIHALAIDFLQSFGRRGTALGSFTLAVLCCLAVACLSFEPSFTVYRLGMALLGKCTLTLGDIALYLWSSEIYPTVVRTQGMGLNIVISRAGAAISPFVKILDHVHPSLPFFLMTITTAVNVLFCAFLPETKGKRTRETFEDFIDDDQ